MLAYETGRLPHPDVLHQWATLHSLTLSLKVKSCFTAGTISNTSKLISCLQHLLHRDQYFIKRN